MVVLVVLVVFRVVGVLPVVLVDTHCTLTLAFPVVLSRST
jgi:hypothetical protein